MGANVIKSADLIGVDPKIRKALEALDDSVDSGLQVLRGFVLHTDTAGKFLGTLPAHADIVDIKVFVETAFNDSGTDLLDLGKAGTTNHFVNDLDVSSTGQKAPTITNIGDVGAAPLPVLATFIGQNSNASAGKLWVSVLWVPAAA